MSSPLPTIGKAEVFDLYRMDRDMRKSLGLGIFPKQLADILERYFTIGEVDVEKANAALAEFSRGREEIISP